MDLLTLQAFRADLGDIPVEDNPKLVQLKSRDFYWYSPVLKRKLGHVTADLVVAPRSTGDVVTILASAHRHGVPVTPRGAGTDILKVAHAYSTNGIIVEAEIPLTAAYPWIDVLAGFPSIQDACRFARNVAMQDGVLLKEVAPIAAPVPHDYFVRQQKFIRWDQSVVVMMAAPQAMHALSVFLAHEKGEMLYRSDQADAADLDLLPSAYELTWNHTTLRALKVGPSVTYLQTQYPDLETLYKIIDIFGDEMPMHNEMIRFDGRIVFSGLPIVRFKNEERLEEIIRIHEDLGARVFNPHRYTLEEGGMKRSDPGQLAFKREADPTGFLNPGKMIAWENPDFDFSAGSAFRFSSLAP